ncbi:MAG: 4Fe-4S dicluster domain-containing protein [Desulfobacterales bacterium]
MSEITNKLMVLEDKNLQNLFYCLKNRNYRLLGPSRSHFSIVYKDIEKADDLPRGYSDFQAGGKYRLLKNDTRARFDYVVAQHSWKKFLFPSEKTLFEVHRKIAGFEICETNEEQTPLAFIGIRPCDLAAVEVLDKILLEGPYQDLSYKHKRENVLMIAVNCTQPSGTCFCASMNTGPKAKSGFDLALTEVLDGDQHYYIVECGSQKGQQTLNDLALKEASPAQCDKAGKLLCEAVGKMGRVLNTDHLKVILMRNFENPRWDIAADRCLCCGNCTLVCPTCFCINIKDTTDLDGQTAYRRREWDSCFTLDHSYISGGSIRTSAKSRYRQWLTHKLASWIEQFGMSGCVGCGRCITWCPVGIDITEEAHAIRESDENNYCNEE